MSEGSATPTCRVTTLKVVSLTSISSGILIDQNVTLRIGSPSDTLSAIAIAPAGRTRQSPKFITWMLRRCFRACKRYTLLITIPMNGMSIMSKTDLFLFLQRPKFLFELQR